MGAGNSGSAGVGRDRPEEKKIPALVLSDALQGLAESLEMTGAVVTLPQLSALHSWLSLFEDGLPPDSSGISVRELVSGPLQSLRNYLTSALQLGVAAGANFALCKQEWESAYRPLRKQLFASSDLLRLQAVAATNSTCHTRACRTWVLLHGLATWKPLDVSNDLALVEQNLKASGI